MDTHVQAPSLGHRGPHSLPLVATLGALGIVYGDIGTSPLYALKEAVKAAGAGAAPTAEAILGVLSLMLWALIVVVSLKYAILILRADNRGEGGIMALLALLHSRDAPPRGWRALILVLGPVGAALLYGDGAITPAISVLSAIEGLKVDAPQLAPLVVPLTVAILIGALLHSVERDDLHRPHLRSGHAGLVSGARDPWPRRDRTGARRSGGSQPDLCGRLRPAHAY